MLEIAAGALPCDAYHHFYHYQSSAQYLWLAETLRALGRNDEALAAYGRSLFQDHFNAEAQEGQKRTGGKWQAPTYDKHPLYDCEFLNFIGELPNEATMLHDEAVAALLTGDITSAILRLNRAIALNAHHSNSFFARGKCHFLSGDYEKARADFTEAIRLSHLKHDAYHRAASDEHLRRGRGFMKLGKLDLAINDFTKALDLHRKNNEAFAARAQAYRTKGNVKLAEQDEAALALL